MLFVEQEHVFSHLHRDELGHATALKRASERFPRDRHEHGSGAIFREGSGELLDDLLRGVVLDGAVDLFTEKLISVFEDRLDVLSGISCSVVQGDTGVFLDRQSKDVGSILVVLAQHTARAREVGHVESREVEGAREADGLGVRRDLGFGLKVLDLAKLSVGDWVLAELTTIGKE